MSAITGYHLGSAPPRFRSKVRRAGDCWEWIGARSRDGYGRWVRSGSSEQLAHRHSYAFYIGPIPDGLTIDHLCRNRACVNPAHLEAVTQRENTLRGVGPAGLQARQSHCKRGHRLIPENVYLAGRRRDCRICRSLRRRRRYLETGQ